jgi:hypothetical protein
MMQGQTMRILAAAGALAGLIAVSQPALAQSGQGQDAQAQQDETAKPAVDPKARIKSPVAEFSGTDKITGRLVSFDVYMNETVQFGALQVTPRVCYSSPEGVEPKTDAFVEIDEITLDRKIRRIFTGWMFAQSPGLNAVEHPVYDVWLTACKQKTDVPPPQDDSAAKQPKDQTPATKG